MDKIWLLLKSGREIKWQSDKEGFYFFCVIYLKKKKKLEPNTAKVKHLLNTGGRTAVHYKSPGAFVNV